MLLQLACLVLGASVLSVGRADLASDVDGWLGDWYAKRLLIKSGLDGLRVGWTEGWLWRRGVELVCPGGLVDLTASKLERVGQPASYKKDNSSRPFVSVTLALWPPGRVVFYGCDILDTKANQTYVNGTGMITGNITTPQSGGIQLDFTYKSAGWWCELRTVSLQLLVGGLSVEGLQVDGLASSVPKSAMKDLEAKVFRRITDLANGTRWNVTDDGPRCAYNYCKV